MSKFLIVYVSENISTAGAMLIAMLVVSTLCKEKPLLNAAMLEWLARGTPVNCRTDHDNMALIPSSELILFCVLYKFPG